jgi:cobalt-precorrin-5B (C1)-methyltransferase
MTTNRAARWPRRRAPPKLRRMSRRPGGSLRRGWTTGACAAAAARAACEALLTGRFPDPVAIRLPRGDAPSFALAMKQLTADAARAGIVKDAGDDPDVTHGALVISQVARGRPGSGVTFHAGEGVGRVTRPGLPLAVGEPAINPGPRAMIKAALAEAAESADMAAPDLVVTVSIPGGEALAAKTLNARLGILGGLSILGTTGVVIPYSCSSWIHSIQRGIDVARASGLAHIAASTGSTSELAVQRLFGLPEVALIDMGDFAGATLKYLRRHPVERLTLAGGFAKLAKLAQGHLDLHSSASRVDAAALAAMLAELGGGDAIVAQARDAAGAGEVLDLARRAGAETAAALARRIVAQARETALATLAGRTQVEVAIFDRQGALIAHAGP